jgi:phytoene dehydrogenase-like protein
VSDAGYRALSFWHESIDDDLEPRAALPDDITVDVAIVGGGLTGLWTAYYLLKRDPGLRVAVIEKHIAGFGASGRNGGWCSALFPTSATALERRHGRPAAIAMRQAMIDTVDEVGRVTAAESIDCDYVKGGTIAFARSDAQLRAAEAEVAEAERNGVDQVPPERSPQPSIPPARESIRRNSFAASPGWSSDSAARSTSRPRWSSGHRMPQSPASER